MQVGELSYNQPPKSMVCFVPVRVCSRIAMAASAAAVPLPEAHISHDGGG